MAGPLIPLLLAGAAFLLGGSRSAPGLPRAPAPQPVGQPLPDSAYGPRVASVPLQTPPSASSELARAEPFQYQPTQQPQLPAQQNIYQTYQGQAPIDRRTAALQLQQYLASHTGSRRDRNTVRYYQGLLGIQADGLDGPITQGAITAAIQAPYQQPAQQYGFEQGAPPPPPAYEQAKGSQGGWEQYQPPQQGSYDQGAGKSGYGQLPAGGKGY